MARIVGKKSIKAPQSGGGPVLTCCNAIMLVSWVIIICWVLFLMYSWTFGVFNQSKMNRLVNQVEKDVVLVINYTEAEFQTIRSSFRYSSSDTSKLGIVQSKALSTEMTITNGVHEIGEEEIHVVFSTDCSPYQDWQSLVQFHSAMVAGQQGKITRIASGCDKERIFSLKALYKELFPSGNYGIHPTPDFTKDPKTSKKYHFYNKPWGLHHWLDHADPPLSKNTIVVLTDPDMIFVRPITSHIKGNVNNLFNNRKIAETDIIEKVSPGHPVAQTYGLGAPWANDNHPKFNRGKICGEGSPCLAINERFAAEHFSVGPPYIGHISDMRKIAASWTRFVPRVYEGYPNLLAEMYAFSMGAAHERLPQLQMDNYMVSNVDAGGEGWPLVDVLDDVCIPPDENGTYFPGQPLPNVVHYCQSFVAGDYGFYKRRIPYDIFTCGGHLLRDPPNNLSKLLYQDRLKQDSKGKVKQEKKDISPKQAKRNAYVLCITHRSINGAIMYYKEKICGNQPGISLERKIDVNSALKQPNL